MEEKIVLKRKIYNTFLKWKNDPSRLPLIVDGLRQVGKSYIVQQFAFNEYDNVIIYDFRHNKSIRMIFDGDLDVDTIIRNSSPYFPDANFVPNKTVLIFEEIGDCPLARTSLKSFAIDKRYDVIATGSLLGVLNYKRNKKIDVPTGYEKIIHMTSLDFEEFLWANGVKEENIDFLKECINKKEEIPEPLMNFYREMIKRYIVIGGMPDSVKAFLKTNNYLKSREILEGLLRDYRSDFGRFVNDKNEEMIDYKLQTKLNQTFDSIPSQLARDNETYKFKYSEIKRGGRSGEFEEPFEWLEKAGLVLRCFNVNAIDSPLESNSDKTYFKAFISDIGLLMAMYPLSTSIELLSNELGSRKGAIYENLLSTMINKVGLPLYYFSRPSDHLEIDFLLETSKGIILLEEKSTNGKMAASRAVMEGKTNYKAVQCYKISQNNFGVGAFFINIPQYYAPFLLDDISKELKNEVQFEPIKYPL